MDLVLSIFPGIDVAGKGFEEEGFCVVRGPDLLWGGEIRTFHPPASVFGGVIGGPPCQAFSQMRHLNPNVGKHGNLIPEFERVVYEAQPDWFVMENVPAAPLPVVAGYKVVPLLLNNRQLGEEQHRLRRFSFGTRAGLHLCPELSPIENPEYREAVTSSSSAVPVKIGGSGKIKSTFGGPTVSAGHGAVMSHERGNMTLQEMCRLQGLPETFTDNMPFTAHGKRLVIGNAWSLPMSRAIARSVKEVFYGRH